MIVDNENAVPILTGEFGVRVVRPVGLDGRTDPRVRVGLALVPADEELATFGKALWLMTPDDAVAVGTALVECGGSAQEVIAGESAPNN